MTLNDHVYDILKYVTTIVLPAFGTLYAAIAVIWGFPYGEAVVGTIAAITTFLGACLGISSKNYEGQGTLNITDGKDGEEGLLLDFDIDDPIGLMDQNTVTLKVNNETGKTSMDVKTKA